MAKYRVTKLFLVLTFVSTMSLAVEEHGLDENGFRFNEDMEFNFETGPKQECIVSLIEEEKDAETEKCYQRIRVDPEDADEETWEDIIQNCGERDVFFLQPKECDRIGYQRSPCHYENSVTSVCSKHHTYCCRRWIWCTRYCEKCSSYRNQTTVRRICG